MIRINDLSFSYGKVKVYDHFHLHIPENQACLITGINGVGKSTLLRLMAGVLRPDRGVITYGSRLGDRPKKKIGFISDRLSLYENLSVSQGIELHRSVFECDGFDDSLIRHTKVGFDQKIKNLSVGQRTIFHLSLIMSQKPEVLLIDEIIHSIDAYLRKVFLDQLITLLAERKLTIVLVNLNFFDIEHMLDRVILLKNGTIAVDEPIDLLKGKVKKVVAENVPDSIPVLSRSGGLVGSDFYIYPFEEDFRNLLEGEVEDLDLTEIVTAFIGGEYD